MDQDQQPQYDPVNEPPGSQPDPGRPAPAATHPQSIDPRIRLLLAKLLGTLTGMIVGMAVSAGISSTMLPDIASKITAADEDISRANKRIDEMNPDWQKAYDDRAEAKEEFDLSVDPLLLEPFTRRFTAMRQDRTRNTGELLRMLEQDPQQLIDEEVLKAAGISPQPEEPADPETQDTDNGRPARLDSLQQAASNFVELRTKDYEFSQIDDEFSRNQSTVTLNEDVVKDLRGFIFLLNLIMLAIIIVSTLLGYISYPITDRVISHFGSYWQSINFGPGQRTLPSFIGFFAGLLLAIFLLLLLFTVIPLEQSIMDQSWFKVLIGTLLVVIMGGMGSIMGATYFAPREEVEEVDEFAEYRRSAPPKLLDTSVIIDGRIYEIAQTRFLDGFLVVTGSVLRELQTLADSADDRKRLKGRSGLELVQRMQDDNRIDLKILDDSQWDSQANGTDDQLMVVCRAIGAHVVTNDYNLNRVAAILNVKVLNINALANAVKTKHLPGDFIEINIADRGKQKGQGVGYLEDGTMVVVEDGGPYIGQLKLIRITSVSQTAQGRLLFARVDAANGGQDA